MQAHRQAAPARQAALAAANAALLGIVLYVPTLQSPLVYDDLIEIVGNTSIRSLTPILSVLRAYPSRPLTNLSYAVDFAVGGINPLAYHVTNVLLHGVNVALVFFLTRMLVLRARGAAAVGTPSAIGIPLMVAALFAVHPVQTEAVTYVSGRAEVLSATFFLVTLLCLGRAVAVSGWSRVGWIAVGGVAFVCAFASKEVAIVLAVILLAYDSLLLADSDAERRRRLWRLHVPLLVVALMVGGIRIWRYLAVEQPNSAGIQWQNVLIELHVLQRYVSLLFIPRSLSIVPSVAPFSSVTDIRIVTGAATLAACIAVAVVARRRERLATFGIVWFLVALVPSALIVVLQDAGHPLAEHRLYLPSIGFFLCVVALADRFVIQSAVRGRRAIATVACAGIVALYAAATLARHAVWNDPVLLWTDAAAKAPDNFTAQYGLAEAYRAASDCPRASEAYRRAMQIRPNTSEPYIGYAWCLLDQGQPSAARDQLELALQRMPRDIHARVALAVVEANAFGNAAKAADICRTALSLAPNDPEATGCFTRTTLKISPHE
jgi:hypothetical protein